MASGVPNFLACALAMMEFGYEPVGIRLDSGDLAGLSKETRRMFRSVEEKFKTKGTQRDREQRQQRKREVTEKQRHEGTQRGRERENRGIDREVKDKQGQKGTERGRGGERSETERGRGQVQA